MASQQPSYIGRLATLLCLVLAAWLPVGSTLASDEQNPIHEWTLPNGLRIVFAEDHRAPVVVSMVWYPVGAVDEPPGLTGLSHVLEHMMFKGTRKVPGGEFSRIVALHGGEQNAFTSKDYTAYYQVFERSRLALSFELEADRMRNLTLPREEFASELKVVMEERRMRIEDNPMARAWERFAATAYTSAAQRQPTIGWMHELEALEVDDLRTWYNTWYAPNNAILVVVGDANPDEVHRLADHYFGPLQPSTLPQRRIPREVTPLGEKRMTLEIPAELPTVIMGYNVPSQITAETAQDAAALAMLAGVLDGGYSARIESNLVRGSQVAAQAGVGYDAFARGDTLFIFSGIPSRNHDHADLEKAFQAEIATLQTTLPTQEELDRVLAQIMAQRVYERDSMMGRANVIGALEASGYGWRAEDAFFAALKAVTPADIRDAAQRYLVPQRRTVAYLIPQAITAAVNGGPAHE